MNIKQYQRDPIEETPAGTQKDCDFDIRVDMAPMAPSNALQTIGPEGQTLIVE